MAGSRKPGPLGLNPEVQDLNDGTMIRGLSPRPGPIGTEAAAIVSLHGRRRRRNIMNWSIPQRLQDYIAAPDEHGIYIVGIYSPSTRGTPGSESDDFLGGNFPLHFNAMYFGVAAKGKSSIRARLRAHFSGSHNRNISEHLKTPGNDLHFIYIQVSANDTTIEHLYLIAIGGGFPWNIHRSERTRLLKAMMRQTEDVPSMPEWYDPSEG